MKILTKKDAIFIVDKKTKLVFPIGSIMKNKFYTVIPRHKLIAKLGEDSDAVIVYDKYVNRIKYIKRNHVSVKNMILFNQTQSDLLIRLKQAYVVNPT